MADKRSNEVADDVEEALPSYLTEDDAPAVSSDGASSDDAPSEETAAPRPHRRWARWAIAAALVLAMGGYVGAAAYAADRIPSGTTVLGVDVGGLGRDGALEALEPAAAAAGEAPVAVTAGTTSVEIVPADSGLAVDAAATVDSLLSFSLDPLTVMRAFTGGQRDIDPVTSVDSDALADALTEAATVLDLPAQDAGVSIASTGASAEPSSDGVAVDVEATSAGLADAWPVETFQAVTAPSEPDVSTADAEAFARVLNAEVLAGDVAMTGPNGDVVVSSEQLTRHGSVVVEEGGLALAIDGESLAAELESAAPSLVSAATGASFSFDASHRIQVTQSQPGRAIDGALLGEAVAAAAQSANRAGELPYRDTEPAITSDDLGVSDFTDRVAEFSTPLTNETIRTKNLVRGAELVTGTVVKPGETFSLLDALSPITADNGYYPAHVIVDGFLADALGGGLSQMATTLYNAAYFAGLEDVEHRPHSKYFSRYPAGREATIYVGAIDVKFRNNTPYALTLNSYVHEGRLHVDVWSTPHFTVETSASGRSNVTPAVMVESDHEGCIDTPIGADGFTITNTRKVFLDGALVDTESLTWTYKPNNGVTCT